MEQNAQGRSMKEEIELGLLNRFGAGTMSYLSL